jgi:hypothetical protein
MMCITALHAQQLNVENVFYSSSSNNTQHGINAAYSFHHVLDNNYDLGADMEDALIDTDYDVIRFPGGAIGNYYRSSGPGYGALKSEVENVANTVNCNGTGIYCFEQDEFAPRNFIYDFIDLVEAKYTATGKKTDVLYMLNLLLHFVYNYSEIPQLDNINDLGELDAALIAGDISQDFYDRIMENYFAMETIIEHPDMRITGIEMGNEFYFYQEVTTFPYPPTNSNPFFSLNSALNTIQPRIANYLRLVKFYKRLMHAVDPSIKVAVPIGGINHLGNQANADLLWNTAVKQWLIQDVDALIPHLYVKTLAPEVDPAAAAADDGNSDMVAIRQAFGQSLNVRFPGILREIVEFFELDSEYRELWMTEYNVNKNTSSSQIWDEWANTFLHGAFLNEMMKIMTSSEHAEYLHYAIQHGWSGGETSFEHCLLTRKDEGDIIERVSHFSNKTSGYLKTTNTVRLDGSLDHTLEAYDFYTDAFYTFEQEEPDCPQERLILAWTNLTAGTVAANLDFSGGQFTLDGVAYEITESSLRAMKGLNTASSCGRTEFDNDETRYDISLLEYAVDVSQGVSLPAYSSGYLDLQIRPVTPDCLSVGVEDSEFGWLALKAYPNPAAEILQIEWTQQALIAAETVSILNALGQTVREEVITGPVLVIDVDALDAGVYYLRVNTASANVKAGAFMKL